MHSWRTVLMSVVILAGLMTAWWQWPARPPDPTAFVAANNLPPEVMEMEALRRELSPTWQNYQRGLKDAADFEARMEAARKANPDSRAHQLIPKPIVVPPKVLEDDPFCAYLVKHSPRAQLVLHRKGKQGIMAAVKGADGKVPLFFDYRHVGKGWVTFRDGADKLLVESHVDGFYTVTVPADVSEVYVYHRVPPDARRLLDVWKLDGSFAERDRILK